MRRQDYKILASALRKSKPGKSTPEELAQWCYTVTWICSTFEQAFGKAFQKERFLRMIEEAGR